MSSSIVLYRGVSEGLPGLDPVVVVREDADARRTTEPLRHFVHHSPDGFAWGYGGSGPSELARCILIDFLGLEPKPRPGKKPTAYGNRFPEIDEGLYQEFKWSFTARWPMDESWEVTADQIRAWLAENPPLATCALCREAIGEPDPDLPGVTCLSCMDGKSDETERHVSVLPVPASAKARPVYNGLLVPFTVRWFDGVPDFKIGDGDNVLRCVRERLCGLCGTRMGATVVFVGGPLSIANRLFTDPAMHKDCASYALTVCPFLAGTITQMAASYKNASESDVDRQVSATRPERFGLLSTRGYQLVRVNGAVYIYADVGTIRWW